MRHPVGLNTLTRQLKNIGFTLAGAAHLGDCYPLGAMANFEISTDAAQAPQMHEGKENCSAVLHRLRNAAIDIY